MYSIISLPRTWNSSMFMIIGDWNAIRRRDGLVRANETHVWLSTFSVKAWSWHFSAPFIGITDEINVIRKQRNTWDKIPFRLFSFVRFFFLLFYFYFSFLFFISFFTSFLLLNNTEFSFLHNYSTLLETPICSLIFFFNYQGKNQSNRTFEHTSLWIIF